MDSHQQQLQLLKQVKTKFQDRFNTNPDRWFFKQVKSLDRGYPPLDVVILLFERITSSPCNEPYSYLKKTNLLKILWETYNAQRHAFNDSALKVMSVGDILKAIMTENHATDQAGDKKSLLSD